MRRGQNIKLNNSLEEIDSRLLSGVQDFSRGSNYRCGKTAREIELETESNDVTELLEFYKT